MHDQALLGLAWLFHLLVLSQRVCDYDTSNASHLDTGGTCRLLSYHCGSSLDDSQCEALFKWKQQVGTACFLFFSLPVPYFFFQAYFDSFLAKACVLLHTEKQHPLIAGHLKSVQTYLRQCIKRETGISHCTHNDSVMSWWNQDTVKAKSAMDSRLIKPLFAEKNN